MIREKLNELSVLPRRRCESMLLRCDAAPRPYWLRDWQEGFGGFAKGYEYGTREDVKRVYSVAFAIRPRTKDKSACLQAPR